MLATSTASGNCQLHAFQEVRTRSQNWLRCHEHRSCFHVFKTHCHHTRVLVALVATPPVKIAFRPTRPRLLDVLRIAQVPTSPQVHDQTWSHVKRTGRDGAGATWISTQCKQSHFFHLALVFTAKFVPTRGCSTATSIGTAAGTTARGPALDDVPDSSLMRAGTSHD